MEWVNPALGSTKTESSKPGRYEHAEYAIYAVFVMCLGIVFGIMVFAPMFPPFGQASATPEAIAAFYQDGNLMKRIGLAVMCFGTPFAVPMFALIANIMKYEMKRPILGSLEYGMGMFGILFTFVMTVCWGTAAFRPERAPEITQALHDMGWLFATWIASATLLQALCIAIAVLADKSRDPILPRWFGYLNIWLIVLAAPACIINIFHTGPFAYDGLLGFWVPYAALFTWAGGFIVAVWNAVQKLQKTQQ